MKYITTLLLSLFFILTTQSQNHKFKKADDLFNHMAYAEAANEYEQKIAKADTEVSIKVLERLGDAYYFNTDMTAAHKWYGEVFGREQESVDAEYMFKYAHALEGVGKHKEAKSWMKKFAKKTNNNDIRQSEFAQQSNSIESILALPKKYELHNLSINTENSDFGTSFYGNQVVFASAKSITVNNSDEIYSWNKQPYLNLYTAFPDKESNDVFDPKPFSKDINTQYHEATTIFTKDLKRVYFTRNNFKKKLKSDDKGVTHLKLYSAELVELNGFRKWENIQELPFNSDDYSVGHPALSDDEKTLYFVSDMPGSIGATDIFMVSITGNNTYSEPKNLGPVVNTSGREMFPFVNKRMFYYASDGYLGLGGLDVFESTINNNSFSTPKNLGAPLNSNKDDFAFVIDKGGSSGYVSSNRKGGKGDDDIYSFKKLIPKSAVCEQYINGYVSNSLTGERIENAKVSLYNSNNRKVEETQSDINGSYAFTNLLDCSSGYKVMVDKQGYDTKSKKTVTPDVSGITEVPLGIKTVNNLIVEESGLLKIKIGLIYFNLDKHFIRNDASVELNKIVLLMTDHPKMHIKIESHTDSRNSDEYNRQLSDRRAKSTRDYIISQGIDASRIESAIGYGESQLINRCTNGAPCSEAEHQLNRRSVFVITKM